MVNEIFTDQVENKKKTKHLKHCYQKINQYETLQIKWFSQTRCRKILNPKIKQRKKLQELTSAKPILT